MDTLKSFMESTNSSNQNNSNNSNNNHHQETGNGNSSSNSGGGFMDKINEMAGGGAQGEKNEDALDKAVDFVQEKFLGQGDQSNESAAEQAKDEAISDFIRDKYKTTTGSDFPIQDKDHKFGA